MRAVVTRPQVDAERIAAPLRERGVDVIVEPLLAVVPLAAAEVRLTGVQAFLLTSANGVRALHAAMPVDSLGRGMPVLAVGDQTARVAEEKGFTQVYSAGGDIKSLVDLVRASLDPGAGTLVHAAGTAVAGDLAAFLGEYGYTVRRERLYDTRPAAAFSEEFRSAMRNGTIDAALLFSPRTARTFADLARNGDLAEACRAVTAYCLSAAVAEEVAALPFRAVRVAEEPVQDSLLAVFDEDNRSLFSPPSGAGASSGETLGQTKGELTMSEQSKAEGGKGKKSSKPSDAATAPNLPAPEAKAKKPAGDEPSKENAAEAPSQPPSERKGGGTVPPSATKPGVTAEAGTKEDVKPTVAASAPGSKTDNGGGAATGEGPAATETASQGGRAGRTAAVAIAVVVILLLALYSTLPWWVDRLPPNARGWAASILPAAADGAEVTEVQEEIQDLRTTLEPMRNNIAALEQQLAQLRQQVSQTPGPAGPAELPPEVLDRLAALEQQVATLAQQQQQPSGLQQTVEALAQRLQEVEANRVPPSAVLSLADRVDQVEQVVRRQADRQDRALAFLLGVGQLRQAVEAGRPFEAELRTVDVVAPPNANVAAQAQPFAGYADTGVPTLTALRQQLEEIAGAIIRADARPADAQDWVNRTFDRVAALVSVRRTDGNAVGTGPAALVSRAEALLDEGNLAGAVDQLTTLEGAPADVAQPWLEAAQARLAAEQVLADLTGDALALVGAGAGGPLQPAAPTQPVPPVTEG